MKYFLDEKSGDIYAYESDGSQDSFIGQNLKPITQNDLEQIRSEQSESVQPTKEEMIASVLRKRDDLLVSAGIRIAPLQDSVDLNIATASEIEALGRWKAYRISLGSIASQHGYPEKVDWPEVP